MKDPNQLHEINPLTGRLKVTTINKEPTKTQQQFKDECDINNIIKRFNNTGEFTHLAKRPSVYGDFSEIVDYQGMLHTIQQANDTFMSLPAITRKKFENDPAQLISFLQNPQNIDEAISLGLMELKNLPTQQNLTNQTKTKKQTTTQPTQTTTPSAQSES